MVRKSHGNDNDIACYKRGYEDCDDRPEICFFYSLFVHALNIYADNKTATKLPVRCLFSEIVSANK